MAGASTTATWTTAGSNAGISWQTALNPSAVAASGRAVDVWNGSALIRRSVDRWNGTALVPQTLTL